MPERRRIPVNLLLLLLILAAGLALRLHNVQRFEVPDEAQLAQMVLHLHGDPFPAGSYPIYPGYPPLFLYLHFLLSLLAKPLLLFLGIIRFPSEFTAGTAGSKAILEAGRLFSALTGTALIALVYRLTRDFFSPRTAPFAALLIAVNPFFVFDAHIFKPDTLVALLLTASLYFSLRVGQEYRGRDLFSAGLFLGLAIAAKYNSAVEILFLATIVLMARKGRGMPLPTLGLRAASLRAAAGACLGFFLGAPNWLVHPLANLRAAWRFIRFHYSGFTFYGRTSAYGSYLKMLVEAFGPILFVLFLAALAVAFIRRKRPGILLALYLTIYIALLGNTSYFGIRITLPLLPAIAILASALLLGEVPDWLHRRPGLRALRAGAIAASSLLVAALALQAGAASIRQFNLLDTASPFSQAMAYRIQHIAYRYPLGRENMTPVMSGDRGFADLTNIPLPFFRGPEAMRFLCTGLLTTHILDYSHNVPLQRELRRRLAGYTPFFTLHKKRFSTFEGDITFWYKAPSWVTTLNLDRPVTGMPRPFALPPDEFASDTVFLPLQNFEKLPFFGKSAQGVWEAKIHSTRPLTRLDFDVLPLQAPAPLLVKVNGRKKELRLTEAEKLYHVSIEGLRPARLHHDFVYFLQMTYDPDFPPFYVVFQPELESSPASTPALGKGAGIGPDSEVPDLEQSDEAPAWCRAFYQASGIDPVLYRFLGSERLLLNSTLSALDPTTDYYPLPAGAYELHIQGERMVSSLPHRAQWRIVCTFIGAGGRREDVITPSSTEMKAGIVIPLSGSELRFMRIRVEGQRESNFVVTEVAVEPDLLAYANAIQQKGS